MAGGLIATLATAALILATIQAAPGQGAAPASGDNRHVLRSDGRALSTHAGKSGLATVKHFLRAKGDDARTLRSLRPAGASWTFRGVTHQRYEQRVSGLRVYGAEAKASFNTKGQLVHLVKYTSPVRKDLRPATKGAAAALRATVKDLYPARTIGIRQIGRKGTTTTFDKGRYFLVRPSVERVAVPTKAGGFKVGYAVDTWDARSNKLYSTLVSGKGRVVSHELRTASDEYNVFTERPRGRRRRRSSRARVTATSSRRWAGCSTRSTPRPTSAATTRTPTSTSCRTTSPTRAATRSRAAAS